MKKYILIVAVLFITLCTLSSFAQINSVSTQEKIYSFDSKIVVNTDATITVTERLVVNAQHKKIRRGIYRELPIPRLGKIIPISLTMDGKEHPFFIKRTRGNQQINFGDDNYITKGLHTYVLTYNFEGAIDFYKNYDEIYWNVTGNNWDFAIDKARAEVILPPDARVQEDGISLYTGKEGEKGSLAKRTGYLTFETTSPIYEEEGFTIAVPFDKGTIQPPSLLKYLLASNRFLISLILFLILGVYCIITWAKVGRDPFYVAVPQYEPPEGTSPALVGFLKNKSNCHILACAMLDLSMKKILEIQREGSEILLRRKTTVALGPTIDDLPQEEKAILDQLFSDSDTCKLNKSIGKKLESIKQEARGNFLQKEREYNISNTKYMLKAIGLLLALGIVPLFGFDMTTWALNIYIALLWLFLFLIIISNVRSFSLLTGIALLFLLLFGVCMSFPAIINFVEAKFPADILCGEGLFVIGIFITALYIYLIPNVTPAGKVFYDYLKGFEKYVNIAESRRVEASDSTDSEKIFCNFLPYAFAIGMHNQWMKKFANILSAATVQEVVKSAGGNETISRYLRQNISSSLPVHTSSGGGGGHSSGSFGGGHSGGGHGGGGGGGR